MAEQHMIAEAILNAVNVIMNGVQIIALAYIGAVYRNGSHKRKRK